MFWTIVIPAPWNIGTTWNYNLGVIIDWKLNWSFHVHNVGPRRSPKLEMLWWVTHLLTPQSMSTINKAQVRWWKMLYLSRLLQLQWHSWSNTIQHTSAQLIGTSSVIIRSLHHQRTVAAAYTIHRMHSRNSPRLLRWHLPYTRPLPTRRRTAKA